MPELKDETLEKTILSSIIHHGPDLFYKIDGTIQETDFGFKESRIIYSSIKYLLDKTDTKIIDTASILGIINAIDKSTITKHNLHEYIISLEENIPSEENIDSHIKRLSKLSYIRQLINKLEQSKFLLEKTNGTETYRELLTIAESPLISQIDSLINTGDETINLAAILENYAQFLNTTKPKHTGIPSGFPLYDKAIGGGFRKPGVHLVGGRAKSAKSFWGVNVSHKVSSLGIPVLYLDTELTRDIINNRWLALLTKQPIDNIERGQFEFKDIQNNLNQSKTQKFFYHNISGKHHHEWISIIRRWIMQEVGFNSDGTTKDCLIILDYIKMMDLGVLKNTQEYQYLGQVITDLHNVCVKYNVPMMSLCQLNREG
ncbi:MAG: DnaB-like helicase C-terminal domain-containing protein, partial [Nanoarchaeota archaeon]